MRVAFMNLSFSVIGGKFIHETLSYSYEKVSDLVMNTYLSHHKNETVNPDSYFLRFPDKESARIIALPSALTGDNSVSGIKWISSYPDNIKNNLQRASAVLILNDYETGYPIACLESSIISAHRTAASAVKGAEALSTLPKKSTKVAFVGAGIIAKTITNYISALDWNVYNVEVFDQHADSAEKLSEHINSKLHMSCTVKKNLEDAIHGAEHVFLCTTASTPYIHDPSVFHNGQVIINISLRDISPDIILNSFNIVDDIEHCLKASTSPHLAEIKSGSRGFINGTIAEVFEGKVNIDRRKPIIFSPFGLGVLDLALGYFIYKQSILSKNNFAIPDFFTSVNRW